MKEKREYVALMDVPSNVMILVKKRRRAEEVGRGKKMKWMDE